jgi:hypothetical protein
MEQPCYVKRARILAQREAEQPHAIAPLQFEGNLYQFKLRHDTALLIKNDS